MSTHKNGRSIGKMILVLLGICLVSTATLFLLLSKAPAVASDELTVNLYFVDGVGASSLKPEERKIKTGTKEEVVGRVIEELMNGPKNTAYLGAIPQGIEISAQIVGDSIDIDFSQDYALLDDVDNALCCASLVWTLTDLEGVSALTFFVDGEEMLKSNGEPLGRMTRDTVIIDETLIAANKEVKHTFTLYFAADGALAPEERTIVINPEQPLEYYVVEELIKGPQEDGHYMTVPPETKINDVRTVDEVCYVDFSQEFVSKHNGGLEGETFTIYSIVNSLTELGHIKKVQFHIDGKKQDEYKGHIIFGQPFERNIELAF